ncbi:MAG: hypothetical protein L3K10_07165 [Thermoplasmata archaeon]|nr:hypothetical protein [Thermoplasmata archaeon]
MPSEEAVLPTTLGSFLLTGSAEARGNASSRKVGVVLAVVGLVFVAVWGLLFLPLLLESPHTFNVCAHGTCQPIPPSQYYSTVAAFTALFLGVAALFLALGLVLRFGPYPKEVRVDSAGFAIVMTSGKFRRVEWSSPRIDCQVIDRRESFRRHPREMAGFPGTVSLATKITLVYPSEGSIDAIFSSARAARVRIEVRRGSGRDYPESLYYTFWPPTNP